MEENSKFHHVRVKRVNMTAFSVEKFKKSKKKMLFGRLNSHHSLQMQKIFKENIFFMENSEPTGGPLPVGEPEAT